MNPSAGRLELLINSGIVAAVARDTGKIEPRVRRMKGEQKRSISGGSARRRSPARTPEQAFSKRGLPAGRSEAQPTSRWEFAAPEYYQLFFTLNPMPMYAFDPETYRFLAVNQAAIKRYGFSETEFLAMRATDLRPAEDRQRFIDSVKNLDPQTLRQGEFRHRTKNGTVIDVEVFARIVESGGRRVALALVNDITWRKQAEQQLRASEEWARSLVENAPMFVVTMGLDGTITSINRANRGTTQEKLIGRRLTGLVADTTGDKLERAVARVAKSGRPETIEALATTAGGEPKWYRGRIGPICNGPRIIGLVLFASEITEEKRVADDLAAAHREMRRHSDTLSATVATLHEEVAHRTRVERELRRSQERLRGLSTRLLTAQEDQRRRIAREVHDELGQALTAIKMELASDRRRRGDAPPRGGDAVNELIDGAIRTVRRIATDLRPGALDDLGLVAAMEGAIGEFERRSGVRCRLDVPEDLAVDPLRSTTIFRVLQEALTNVARHASARRVTVSLAQPGTRLRLTVRDNGRGIRKADARRATSLGLVGMRERARLLNGEFRVKGVPGKGTKVELELPVEPTAVTAAAAGSEHTQQKRR